MLDDTERVAGALLDAADRARTTVLGSSFHKFSPQGVSGVVVIAESHISVHTWPEFGYAAVDVFTCGDHAMPRRAATSLVEAFAPTNHDIKVIARGVPGQDRQTAACPASAPTWNPALGRRLA